MDHQQDSDTVITYRYVRLAMFVLVAAIGVVVIEFSGGSRALKGSISAYYYAPAGSVLVAAMVAIGALLICIKGSTTGEDALLNTAGMLAPLVGLIPTPPCDLDKPRTTDCQALEIARQDFVSTTIWVIGVMAVVGFLLLLFGSTYMEKRRPQDVPAQRAVPRKGPLVIAVAVAGVLLLTYNVIYEPFMEHAHMLAAIGTFLCIGLAALVDGKHCIAMGYPVRGKAYLGLGAALALAAVALPHLNKTVWEFKPVFSAEVVGITAFAVFWLFQTIDLWWDATRRDMKGRVNDGVQPPPDEPTVETAPKGGPRLPGPFRAPVAKVANAFTL